MAAFLVDANLPRALSRLLTSTAVIAYDVRDVGLADRSDGDIATYASTHGYVVITRDVGFGAALYLAGEPFPGILVVRYPEVVGVMDRARDLMAAIGSLGDALLTDSVVVVEPGRVRVRRAR